MKKQITILSLIIFLMNCKNNVQEQQLLNTGKTAEKNVLLDTLISLAKVNSYNSSNVDWTTLKNEMTIISQKQDSIYKLGKASEHMFEKLGDYHGMLMYDYKIAFSHRSEKFLPPNDSIYKVMGSTKINEPYSVYSKVLNNNIAYIEILGTGVMQDKQITDAINEIRIAICSLKKVNPKGWIIDLRCNMGGNMHPTLAGLAELLPNANLGGDTKDGIDYNSKWLFKDGNFYENGNAHYKSNLHCENLKNDGRIAVLTSGYTASSGEAVTSSLKGQKNVRIIGQKTRGLSSTNGWFILSDKWIFAPMTAYYMSKHKTVHKDGIIPDIKIEEKLDLNNLLNGNTIDRAIEWVTFGK